MAETPFFSVIMASHNTMPLIEGAVASVVGQTFQRFELLVQDNASTDGTVEFIQSLKNGHVRAQSSPDSGVYEAWNRALARAQGEWVLFLGADDRLFTPHVLARSARLLQAQAPDILFAQAALAIGKKGRIKDYINRSRGEIFRHFISGMPLLTPAVFFRRSLFAHQGFDTSYRIAGDFAFAARHLSPHNLVCLPLVASYMELGGLSSSVRHATTLLAERRRVLQELVAPRAATLVGYCSETLDDNASPLDEPSPLSKEFAL